MKGESLSTRTGADVVRQQDHLFQTFASDWSRYLNGVIVGNPNVLRNGVLSYLHLGHDLLVTSSPSSISISETNKKLNRRIKYEISRDTSPLGTHVYSITELIKELQPSAGKFDKQSPPPVVRQVQSFDTQALVRISSLTDRVATFLTPREVAPTQIPTTHVIFEPAAA